MPFATCVSQGVRRSANHSRTLLPKSCRSGSFVRMKPRPIPMSTTASDAHSQPVAWESRGSGGGSPEGRRVRWAVVCMRGSLSGARGPSDLRSRRGYILRAWTRAAPMP